MGVGGQHNAPAALPPGKTRYLLYMRLGWSQGRPGRVGKISPPPGFDPRTIQPAARCYTDCAIPALFKAVGTLKRKGKSDKSSGLKVGPQNFDLWLMLSPTIRERNMADFNLLATDFFLNLSTSCI